MKKIIQILALTSITLGVVWSCSDDDTYPRIDLAQGQEVITVVSPTATDIEDIILTKPNKTNTWQTFAFESNADLSKIYAPSAITYEVVIDKAGDNFNSQYLVKSSTTSPIAVTQDELNSALVAMGYKTAGDQVTLDVKVIARIEGGGHYISSSTVDTFIVTGFGEFVFKPLYITGSAFDVNNDGVYGNDWTQNTSVPMFIDKDNADIYYMTAYFNAGELKLLSNPGTENSNWKPQYGDDKTNTGKLGVNLGDGSDPESIKVPTAGYYTFQVNLTTMTYTLTPYTAAIPAEYNSVGIVGGAAIDWNTDTTMTKMIKSPHLWIIDRDHAIPLTAQKKDNGMKFRVDAAWTNNWGYNSYPYGVGEKGGPDNIPVDVKGNYNILFNDLDGSYILILQPEKK